MATANEPAPASLDTRILVARGLVQDLVSNLARLMGGRVMTGAEEVKLQDTILHEMLTYVKALQGPGAALPAVPAPALAQDVDRQIEKILEPPIPFGVPKAKNT